jgi:hypothetical protein
MNKIHEVIVAINLTNLHLSVDRQTVHLRRDESLPRLDTTTTAQWAHLEVLF